MVSIFIFHAVFVFDTVVCILVAVVCVYVVVALVVVVVVVFVVVVVVYILVIAFAVVTFEVFALRCADVVKNCTHLHVRRARCARLKRFSFILGKDHCQSFKDGEDVENRENDDGFSLRW